MGQIYGTLILTTAAMGNGKTYSRCARAIPELLRDGVTRHISNFTPRCEDNEDGEGMSSACQRIVRVPEDPSLPQGPKRAITDAEVRERIVKIPPEVVKLWREHQPNTQEKGDGPWNFFQAGELQGAHIALDEFHKFCPETGCQAAKKAAWMDWFSTIRHEGATVELITQSPGNISANVQRLCSTRIQIFSRDNDPVPILGCRFGTLRQFFCKWRNRPWKLCGEIEESNEAAGKWEEVRRIGFVIDGKLWGRYKSNSEGEGQGGSSERPEAWRRCTWSELIVDYFRETWLWSLRNVAVVAVALWLVFGGGVKVCAAVLKHEIMYLANSMTQQKLTIADESKKLAIENEAEKKPLAGDEGFVSINKSETGDGRSLRSPSPVVAQEAQAPAVFEYKLLGLMPGQAYFHDLGWFHEGEEMEVGGLRLESIDFQRCRVTLSDDRVFRLPSASGSTSLGGVPGGVPSGIPAGAPAAPPRGSEGAERYAERQQSSSSGSRPLVGAGIRRDDSSERTSSKPAGDH
jgi:hypothetical protein